VKWRASIERVGPNALREWIGEARVDVDDRLLDKAAWRDLDSARRFSLNDDMRKLQRETWFSRSNCYWFARLELRLARIWLTEPSLEAVEHLAEAARYRELARSKWPDVHDHPQEQWIFQGPLPPTEAQRADVKKREAEAKASRGIEPKPIQTRPYHLAKWAAEREARRVRREELFAQWAAERAAVPAAAPAPSGPLAPGDRVILSRSATSGWADSLPRRPWVVMACDCGLCLSCSHVALDVPTSAGIRELYPESSEWRHVGVFWLRRKGELSRDVSDAWADYLSCKGGQAAAWASEQNANVAEIWNEFMKTISLSDALGEMS
jgi:hypothetical protein